MISYSYYKIQDEWYTCTLQIIDCIIYHKSKNNLAWNPDKNIFCQPGVLIDETIQFNSIQ